MNFMMIGIDIISKTINNHINKNDIVLGSLCGFFIAPNIFDFDLNCVSTSTLHTGQLETKISIRSQNKITAYHKCFSCFFGTMANFFRVFIFFLCYASQIEINLHYKKHMNGVLSEAKKNAKVSFNTMTSNTKYKSLFRNVSCNLSVVSKHYNIKHLHIRMIAGHP